MENLNLSYYRVTISAAGLNNSGTSNGFLDDWGPREWSSNSAYPTTRESSLAKTRAKLRWDHMIALIGQTMVAPVNIVSINKPGASADTAASQIAFTLVIDREDYLYAREDGATLRGDDALKRVIARALNDSLAPRTQVYDPTNGGENADRMDVVEVGPLAVTIPMAELRITVTKVQFT
jgi:hypothetical protein